MVGILLNHSRFDLSSLLERVQTALRQGKRTGPEVEPSVAFRVRTRLGSDIGEKLAAAYREGVTSRELARQFGLAKSTVLGLLEKAGVEIRHYPGLRQQDVAEAAALYAEGWPLKRIGERYEVSGSTVRLRLLDAGVELRGCRRRPKEWTPAADLE